MAAAAPTTSKKHANFVRESMLRNGKPKSVDELPGIGPKAKEQLAELGLVHAHQLLGQLLVCDRDEARYLAFLEVSMPVLRSYPHHYSACFACLDEWCNLNL